MARISKNWETNPYPILTLLVFTNLLIDGFLKWFSQLNYRIFLNNIKLRHFSCNSKKRIINIIRKKKEKIKFIDKTCLVIWFTWNKLIAIRFGCQLTLKKFITKTKMLCVFFDIHRSKFVLVEQYSTSLIDLTYFWDWT